MIIKIDSQQSSINKKVKQKRKGRHCRTERKPYNRPAIKEKFSSFWQLSIGKRIFFVFKSLALSLSLFLC